MHGALIRYRVVAYVVGVLLLVLTLVAMPMKYFGGEPALVEIVARIHGFSYIVYLVVAYDLARRNRWSTRSTILLLLAGTVPFVSFVAERKVTAIVTPTLPSARS